MSKGPYGETNFGQSFNDKIKEYLKENLNIELNLHRNWDEYSEDQGRPVFDIGVQLVLSNTIISKDKITISQ